MTAEMLRRFLPGREPFVTLLAKVFSAMNLELVVDPFAAADVQLPRVLAILEGADVRPEIPEDMAPTDSKLEIPKS